MDQSRWHRQPASASRVAHYDHPRLAPDGRSIVVYKEEGGDRNLWLYDIARDTLSKFTLTSPNDWPVWSSDSRTVIYGSNRAGTQYDIFAKPVDGSAAERALLARPLTQIPRAGQRVRRRADFRGDLRGSSRTRCGGCHYGSRASRSRLFERQPAR